MTLEGRNIIVTGAAGGLGESIACTLAEAGAKLIIADIAEEAGREVAQKLSATFLPVDLADAASISKFANKVKEITAGELAGLVNNGAIATGIGGIGFEDIEMDSWDLVMRVNVRGTWLMTRAVTPMLRADGNGRIVNLASDTALWGAPNLMSYVASKGAIISMTRSLARELGPDNIGVTAVAPGILTTQSTEYVPEARHQQYENGRAVPGPQGTDDVAGVVAFLLSKEAITLTGQLMPVNNEFVFG